MGLMLSETVDYLRKMIQYCVYQVSYFKIDKLESEIE